MHLAFEQQRIDHVPEVVDDRVAQDCGDAAVRIDLDLGDVAAVREGSGRRVLHLRVIESRLHAGRESCRIARRLRDIKNIHMPVGADDAELAVAEFNVGGGRLKQVRGDLLALVNDLERRLVQRRAADGERTRAAGQPAR